MPVRYELAEGVATLTIDRPERRNAIDGADRGRTRSDSFEEFVRRRRRPRARAHRRRRRRVLRRRRPEGLRARWRIAACATARARSRASPGSSSPKPTLAAISGLVRRRRARACPLVPTCAIATDDGAIRLSSTRLHGRAVHRRWHPAAATGDRACPRRSTSLLTGRGGRGRGSRAHRPRQRAGRAGPAPGARPGSSRSLHRRPPAGRAAGRSARGDRGLRTAAGRGAARRGPRPRPLA